MKIVLLQVGKTDKEYIQKGIADFSSRICRITGFEIQTVPDLKNRKSLSYEEQQNEETRRILKCLKTGDHIILLDERGKQYNSIAFSELLSSLFNMSLKRLVFIIGGPYGFSKEMYNKANRKLSLSPMTFSHQLVRLLFIEQLYRGLSIIKGFPYHNE